MTNRRDFFKQLGIVGIASGLSKNIFSSNVLNSYRSEDIKSFSNDKPVWAVLMHLSYNMWQDFTPNTYKTFTYPANYSDEEVTDWAHYYQPQLTCDKSTWDLIIKDMVKSGVNMVLIDLGDGVQYASHPEIAVKNAWSPEDLKKELKKIRSYGIEPIPKLNFSAAHKAWLGQYQFALSTKNYYNICKDLISEVIALFDNPRFFHLGMDEETCNHQTEYNYIVVRQNELWWNDFYYLVDQVEKHNVRSWIWSDMAWQQKDDFFKKMPKSVLQSNWNYEEKGPTFNENGEANDKISQAFFDLEKYGYDQIPSASIWLNGHWNNYENFDNIVKNTKQIIAPERLKGFMQTIWMPTLDPCYPVYSKAIELVKNTKKKYYI